MTFTGPGAQQPAGTNLFGQDPWQRRGEQQAAIAANTIPVGVINAYYGTVAPAGWLLCDGTTFSASTYPTLAALLGGTTLPNLKGRVVVGYDAGQVEFDTMGETGGLKTLTSTQMPGHLHGLNGHNHGGATASGGGSSHDHGLTNHNHGGGTGIHAHQVNAGLGGGNVTLGNGAPTGSYNILEQTKTTDSVGVANSTQGSADTAHTHSTTVAGDSGNTTSVGSGAAGGNLPPYIALSYIIKAG